MQGECGCLKVASRLKEGTLRVQATNWAFRFEVTTDGAGVVSHAGAVLLQELADRLGLTRILGWRGPQGRRRHPDAQVLWNLAVLLADGGDCLCNLAAFRISQSYSAQWLRPRPPGGSSTGPPKTAMGWPGCAPPGRTRASVDGRRPPEPELLVIDTDATLVLAHSDNKEGAAGTYKGSFGFAPLLAYLDRGAAPREPLAGILRPSNAPPAPCSMRAKTPSDAIEPGAESARWRDLTDRALGWTESDAVNEP
jgi:hypothetical protein